MSACNCCDMPGGSEVTVQGHIRYAVQYPITTPYGFYDPEGFIPADSGFGSYENDSGTDGHLIWIFGQEDNTAEASNRQYFDDWYKQAASYRLKFQPPASCYFKVWWDEVTHPWGSSSITSSTPKEFEWSPPSEDGLCIPSGYDPADDSTWPVSDTYTLDVPSGINTVTVIENIRWSAVSGYTPPTDGSANGFPP